jgi:serine-type D-Ala-D-Ala carboxypeptidase (penicillin-binding protein 5/6)
VKKETFVKFGSCLLAGVIFLTGCEGFRRLDKPYKFSERTALYESSKIYGKAKSFANNLCVVSEDASSQDTTVTSKAAVLFDLKDRTVLFSKNPFERLYPASITKVMTALVALKYGDLSDEITITKDCVITESGVSLCGIKPGDKLTLEQLLYGLLLPSGNDAGAAIATHIAGGKDKFADLMNEKAKRVGATGTHFVNPHGLHDEDHYTTAYDLYLIFNEAMKYPEFRKIIGTAKYNASYSDKDGKLVSVVWKDTNWFLSGERKMPEGLTVVGGKTGTTHAAGSCLIMESMDSSNDEYISIILKAANHPDLYDNMTRLLCKIAE